MIDNKLISALGMDEPYPVQEVLRRLSDAAEILLNGYSSDHHGHEITALCRDRAKILADRIDSYLKDIQKIPDRQ